jgi:hypothetical protein
MREGQEATNNNPKNAHGYSTYVDLIYTTQTQHEYVYVGRPTNYLVRYLYRYVRGTPYQVPPGTSTEVHTYRSTYLLPVTTY